MSLKLSGLNQTIGKTIAGYVLRTGSSISPREQVFIVFTDNTYYELYGESINSASAVDRGGMEGAESYALKFPGDVKRVE